MGDIPEGFEQTELGQLSEEEDSETIGNGPESDIEIETYADEQFFSDYIVSGYLFIPTPTKSKLI